MNRHLELLGLDAAGADFALIPLTPRWGDGEGATPTRSLAAIGDSSSRAGLPSAVRALAIKITHPGTWMARRKAAA